ncbi:DUF6044 family protein [Cellulomonas sp. S1-8]|uniref:DUF6044 family protein n=1 Tax=Cellulomonas sp. S1-8 TaxID=2904790 RepID=UPI002243C7A9|nr:DUF6044 family protein [Cellulomonas sp. S1-8]UZN01916.1 YfhO family protein [Cellulomonas sp. S1-8]
MTRRLLVTGRRRGRAAVTTARGWSSASVVAWGAVVAFTVVGIGPALIGRAVFVATDLLTGLAPWSSYDHGDGTVDNPWPGDTVDSVTPRLLLLKHTLLSGRILWWNPYVAGGSPLGSLPDSSFFSPMAWPWLVLPDTYAPGAVKLLEIVVACAGMALLLRRLGLSPAARAVGALAFVSSGFMIAWTGWPQTRVAALVPLLLWAVDRVVGERRRRDALLIAVILASMLLGGFPAIVVYAVYTCVAYAAVRLWRARATARDWCTSVVIGVSGALLGVGLAAWQLVPFVVNAAGSISFDRRTQTPGMHLDWSALATAFAPGALGDVDSPLWGGSRNPVERFSFVGAATLVLVVAAFLRSRGRPVTHPLVFAVVGAATGTALVYGGLLLGPVQELPGFDTSYVGRLRVILGLLLAVAAAYGFDQLRARAHATGPGDDPREGAALPGGRRRVPPTVVVPAVVGLAVVLGLAVAVHRALGTAPRAHVADVRTQLVLGGVLAAVGVAAVLLARSRRRRGAATVALLVLPVLMAGQAASVAVEWWPRSPVESFYPTTATHDFLAENLGQYRFTSTGFTMLPGSSSAYELRSTTGHAFHTEAWRDLLEAADPDAMRTYTYSTMSTEALGSPVLDRTATRFAVDAPDATIPGDLVPTGAFGTYATMPAGARATTAPVAGDVRGARVDLPTGIAPVDGSATVRLRLSLLDATGHVLSSTVAQVAATAEPTSEWIALTTTTADGPFRLRLEALEAVDLVLPVDAAARWVVAAVVPDDDLVVVHTGDATVYERPTALPRFRWASRARVVTDPDRRVELLAEGALDPGTVLLDDRADLRPTDPDATATVRVVHDDGDAVELRVSSTGAGYAVVADAWRAGWTARVDGRAVDPVGADHAMWAVPLTAGTHRVELVYEPPGLRAGALATALSAVVLVAGAAVVAGRAARARRARRVDGSDVTNASTDDVLPMALR